MSLVIKYRLDGAGWSECTLTSSQSQVVITASYLSDALRNLVVAATAIVSGFHRVSFGFDEEPGEFRWVITSSSTANEIELEILSFNELWSGMPDSEGQSLFRVTCTAEEFAKAVQLAATEVLEQHGEAGYLKEWIEHPFPTAQLAELGRVLAYKGPKD